MSSPALLDDMDDEFFAGAKWEQSCEKQAPCRGCRLARRVRCVALLSLVGALPVGLMLSIFMTVDVFSHGELLRLASMATGSNGLAVCYALLAVLTLLSWVAALFVAVGFEEGEAKNSCRVVNVLCFLLPASFLLLGVVALNFPVGSLKAGMSSMLVEQEYMHVDGAIVYPSEPPVYAYIKYTTMGQLYNYAQIKFECCGVFNSSDYDKVNFRQRYGLPTHSALDLFWMC
jgi:hypothetical protein